MTGAEVGLGGIALLLVLILLRIPIGISLITVSFGGIWVLLGARPAWGILTAIPYDFASSWALTSVPMFLLMGFFCYQAGLTTGLFDAARKWLSALPGGLAIASIFGSAGFAAVTGSSVACAAAMGKIAVPEMLRYGYDNRLATGTVAAAGTIGALIPPSIIMIIYGIFAQVPITQLFLGGIVAGLLTAVGYVAVVLVVSMIRPDFAPPVKERVSYAERIAALGDVWPVLLLIAGVFGGLFSGIFTPTEAGAAGALLSAVIAAVKRTLTWTAIRSALSETARTTAAIFVIAIGASLLTRFLTLSGAGKFLSSYVISLGADPLMLMLGIALMYLVLGMFLEPIGAMLLTIPILMPVMDSTGMSLVWFGVVLTKFLEIGMITPPIGLNVFVIKGVVGDMATTTRIFSGVLWFLIADLIVVAALMAFPGIVLYLPSLIN